MQTTTNYSEELASNGIFYRHYNKSTPGVPLIMLMGYGGSMFSWPMDFVNKLAEHFPLVLFDNRGTGRSQKFNSEDIDLRMLHFAEDLNGLVEHLHLAKVNLFGYSMGGCMALEFAKHFPTKVKKLVLQSTTAGGALYTGSDQDVKDRMANPRGSTFDEMFFDFFDLCMSSAALEEHRPLLGDICANARPYPTSVRVLQMQLKAFRYFDASSYIKEIEKPALLFHGKSDRILKVANGEALSAKLSGCQPEILENCGHCPHIEYSDRIVSSTRQFLSK